MTDDLQLKAELDEYRAKQEAATDGEWKQQPEHDKSIWSSFRSSQDRGRYVDDPVAGFVKYDGDRDFICLARNSDLHDKLWAALCEEKQHVKNLNKCIEMGATEMQETLAEIGRLRKYNERLICENIALTFKDANLDGDDDESAPEGGD